MMVPPGARTAEFLRGQTRSVVKAVTFASGTGGLIFPQLVPFLPFFPHGQETCPAFCPIATYADSRRGFDGRKTTVT